MNICAWLERVKELDALINAKMAEKEQLYELATKITAENDGMPHGTDISRKVENAGIKLAMLSQEIDKQIDIYIDYKRNVITELEKLPEIEYKVLHRRYIRFMSDAEIGKDLGYSRQQIHRIRTKGLQMLENVTECYKKS